MKFFEKLLFEPDSKSYTSGNDYSVMPVQVQIPSGTEALHGWWFGAEFPKAILIQFHGNAENITSHAPYVAWLAEHGISVLCFDYSGYGKSTGKPSIAQVRLDCDAASAIPKLKSRFLVIHSLTDQVVKLGLAKQLSRLIHANSQDLWLVDGPQHLKTFTAEHPEFRKQLLDRIEHALQAEAASG